MLIDTISVCHLECQMPFLPEVREMSPFSRGEQALKFLRNSGFYVASRNPSVLQTELVSGYLDSLSEFPLA